MKNRLLKFLQWLHINYPNEGWNTFYTSDGALNWHLMVWSGHSQGAGITQAVSVDYSVARVVQIANGFVEVLTQATPANRIFTFYHQEDQTVKYMPQVNIALKLSQFGPLVLVNDITSFSQFGTSHMLMTNVTVPIDEAHGAPVVDARVPFSATDPTMPLWDPFVWAYLIGEPSALTPASILTPTQQQPLTSVSATTTKPSSSLSSSPTTRPPSPSSSSSSCTFASQSYVALILCSFVMIAIHWMN